MHRNPDNVSTKSRRIAELARRWWANVCVTALYLTRECMIRGTVCSNASTYGSVGAPGGQPPGLFFAGGVSRPSVAAAP